MNQLSLMTGFERGTKRTVKQVFLEEMLAVVPWDALVALVTPHAPAGLTGRPPYPVLMLLRIHFLQQWFSLSDEGVGEALHDVQVYRAFAGIDLGATCIPDATTVLRFQTSRAHGLASGSLATINAVLEAKGLLLRRERRSMPPLPVLPARLRTGRGRGIRRCTRRGRGTSASP